jgi:hypothetical protein
VKILEILEAYIKFWNKIISFDMRKKGEFGSPWSGFLGFKRDTPIRGTLMEPSRSTRKFL